MSDIITSALIGGALRKVGEQVMQGMRMRG
jgi:hypothetical protein